MTRRRFIILTQGLQVLNIGISTLVLLLVLPVILNTIGLENYGKWAKIFLFTTLIAVVNLGVSNALTAFLNSHDSHVHWVGIRKSSFRILFGLICVLIIVHLLTILDLTFQGLTNQERFELLLFGDLTLVFGAISGLLQGVIRYLLLDYWISIVNLLLTSVTYGVLLVLVQKLTYSLYAAPAIAYFIALLVYLTITYKYIYASYIKRQVENDRVISTLKLTGHTLIGLQNGLNQPTSRLLAEFFLSSNASYAILDIGFRVLMFFGGIVQSISAPLFSMWSGNHDEEPKRTLNKSLFLSFLISVLSVVIFSFFGQYLLKQFGIHIDGVFNIILLSLFFYLSIAVAEPINRYLWVIENFKDVILLRLPILLLMPVIAKILLYYFNEDYFLLSFAMPFSVSAILLFRWKVKNI